MQMTGYRCLYSEARLLLRQRRLLPKFILVNIRVVWADIDNNADLLFSDVCTELLHKVLPLLLKLRHLVEYTRYHIFVRAVSGPAHARWSLREAMLFIGFLARMSELMPSSSLIDVL